MAREYFKPFKTATNNAFIEISEWVDEEDHPIIEEGILTKKMVTEFRFITSPKYFF